MSTKCDEFKYFDDAVGIENLPVFSNKIVDSNINYYHIIVYLYIIFIIIAYNQYNQYYIVYDNATRSEKYHCYTSRA